MKRYKNGFHSPIRRIAIYKTFERFDTIRDRFMSGIRWFLIDQRYLSISIKLEFSDPEAPVEAFTAYIADIAPRPLFAFHIASLWTAPFRCLHFAILLTSFESFSPNSDILETDDECIYPSPGYAG